MRNSSLIILLSWLSLASACKSTSSKSVNADMGKSYLALGDSYTIGVSVGEQERFPMQLAATVKGLAKPTIIARNGWTTADLQEGISAAGIAGKKYDLVTLLIGVNNEFQARSIKEYEEEFTQLLKQAIGFADDKPDHVIVLSIPDYGFTPFGEENRSRISPRIDEFNAVNKKISASLKVHYADITPVSRKALEDVALVADDGLHPSGKQYGRWVGQISKTVDDILKK